MEVENLSPDGTWWVHQILYLGTAAIALRHLTLLIQTHKPDVLILEETRCSSSGIEKILNKIKKPVASDTQVFRVDYGYFGMSLQF